MIPKRQPSPLADVIVQIVRKIAERDGVSLEQAAATFTQQVHRRAEELRQERKHQQN